MAFTPVGFPRSPPFEGQPNSLWNPPAGSLMVYDPAQDDAYDALVIRDMQTTYGAYWKMQEALGAVSLVSRGPLFPTMTLSNGAPNAGEGPIPQSVAQGFTNRAWQFKTGQAASTGLTLTDPRLFSWINNQNWSVELWILQPENPNRGGGNGNLPLTKQPSFGWKIGLHPTTQVVFIQRSAVGGIQTASSSPGGSALYWKWIHVACTYDGLSVRSYTNGANVATTASANPVPDVNSALEIGSATTALLSRIALYGNIVLTPAQIAEHAAAGSVGYGPVPSQLPPMLGRPSVRLPYGVFTTVTVPPDATLSDSDSGSGDDTAALSQSDTDTGSGSDDTTLTVAVSDTDTGTAVSDTGTLAAAFSDSDTGSDSEATALTAAIPGTDDATSSETGTPSQTTTDTGTDSETEVLAAAFSDSDTGTSDETAIVVSIVVEVADDGTSTVAPGTLTVTDNFNRADESPIGAPWDTSGWNGQEMALVSNRMSALDRGGGIFIGACSYSAPLTDYETVIELGETPDSTGTYELYIYSADYQYGIDLFLDQTHIALQVRRPGPGWVDEFSLPITAAAGDLIYLRRFRSFYECWYKSVSGSWQLIGRTTVTEIEAAAPLTFVAFSTATVLAFDNFRIGDITANTDEDATLTATATTDDENGSTDELVTLLAEESILDSDSNASDEQPTLTAVLSDSDDGTSDETAALAVAYADTDTGAGDETELLHARLSVSDTATSAENASAVGDTSKAASDSGTGTEQRTLTVAAAVSDHAAGVDAAAVHADKAGTDTGTGSDVGRSSRRISQSDTASAIDSAIVRARISKSDTGHGVDALVRHAKVTADTGHGTESASVRVSFHVTDNAQTVDETIQQIAGLLGLELASSSEAAAFIVSQEDIQARVDLDDLLGSRVDLVDVQRNHITRRDVLRNAVFLKDEVLPDGFESSEGPEVMVEVAD